MMAKGIPDDAWKPIEGDDKKVASALKKRNKAEGQGQGDLEDRMVVLRTWCCVVRRVGSEYEY